MLDLLGGLGYAPYRFDGQVLRRREAGEREQNLFFVPEQQAAVTH
jgi:hypothetical protein